MVLISLQLPDYIINSLEDSGVKYVPYVLLVILAGRCVALLRYPDTDRFIS